METYGSIHEAFHGRLDNLLENGDMSDYVISNKSVGANFGSQPRRTLEVVADSFMVTDPRNRLIADCRTSNLSYSVANFLWSINENVQIQTSSHIISTVKNSLTQMVNFNVRYQIELLQKAKATY